MINNNVSAHIFYDYNKFSKIYNDYLKWNTLAQEEKNILIKEFEILDAEETPALALKRHGITPSDNWQEVTGEINKRHSTFYKEHPYFYLRHLTKELKSIVEAPNVIFKNYPRGGRALIKEINVIKNDDYLIFEYNRSINSTQTSVVFSGVPLKYIGLIDELGFLVKYIPKQTHVFTILEKIYKSEHTHFTFYYLKFN